MGDTAATTTEASSNGGRYRWVVVLVLAAITNVSYGTTYYAFSVLLGADAAAGEFGPALLSGALGLGGARGLLRGDGRLADPTRVGTAPRPGDGLHTLRTRLRDNRPVVCREKHRDGGRSAHPPGRSLVPHLYTPHPQPGREIGLAECYVYPRRGAASNRRHPRAPVLKGPPAGGDATAEARPEGNLRGARSELPAREPHLLAGEHLLLSRVHGDLRAALPPGGLPAGVRTLGVDGGGRGGARGARGIAGTATLSHARGPVTPFFHHCGHLPRDRPLRGRSTRLGRTAVALPVRGALRDIFWRSTSDACPDHEPPLRRTALRPPDGPPVHPPRPRHRRWTSGRRRSARCSGELRPPPTRGHHPAPPRNPHHPRHRARATARGYIKMSKGSSALTDRFGTSTVWLMRRSTATLQSA